MADVVTVDDEKQVVVSDDTVTVTEIAGGDQVTVSSGEAVPIAGFWQRSGTTLSPITAGDGISVDAGAVFNSTAGSNNFSILKLTTGTAYSYTASTDAHVFDGTTVTLTAPADSVLLSAQPTGGTDLAVATTKYVDDAISAEDFWQRSGTTLSPQNAGDGISVDAGAVFNSTAGSNNFSILKLTTGTAYSYTASTDAHVLDGTTVTLTAPANSVLLSAQPTGGTDLAVATTKYVDDAITGENFWDRTPGNLFPETLTDSLGIGINTPLGDVHIHRAGGSTLILSGNANGDSDIQFSEDAGTTARFTVLYDSINERLKIQGNSTGEFMRFDETNGFISTPLNMRFGFGISNPETIVHMALDAGGTGPGDIVTDSVYAMTKTAGGGTDNIYMQFLAGGSKGIYFGESGTPTTNSLISSSGVFTLTATANNARLSAQPTGTQDLAIATTKYVDDAVSAEDFWQRSGTILSPQNAGDNLSIDGAFTANSAAGDSDVQWLKQTTGTAYVYDAGLDSHTFGGIVGVGTTYGGAILNLEDTSNGTGGGGFIRSLRLVPTITGTATDFAAQITLPKLDGSFTQTNTKGLQVFDVTTANGAVATNYAGVLIRPLSTATNNSHLIIGQTTIPSGNWAIYSASNYASIFSGAMTFNNGSGDYDFTVKSQTNASMFVVDASTDRIGVGTSVPDYFMDVRGQTTVQADGSGGIAFRVFTQDRGRTMTITAPVDADTAAPFLIKTSNSFDFQVDSRSVLLMDSNKNAIFNDGNNDQDFTINKDITAGGGSAYTYDAGLDTFTTNSNHLFTEYIDTEISRGIRMKDSGGTQRRAIHGNSSGQMLFGDASLGNINFRVASSNTTVAFSTTGAIFNAERLDLDFTIRKQSSGNAYVYSAGTDWHTFSGLVIHEALRGTVSSVGTSTTLTHTVTHVRQTASGITTTLWASPTTGDKITIRNRGGGSNTIGGNGTNIEGSATATIPDGASFDLVYDGTSWTI